MKKSDYKMYSLAAFALADCPKCGAEKNWACTTRQKESGFPIDRERAHNARCDEAIKCAEWKHAVNGLMSFPELKFKYAINSVETISLF